MRKSEPNFKPLEAVEVKSAIWMKLPKLPMEYFNDKILLMVGKYFGKPPKTDITTVTSSRGKFARICVVV